MEKIKCLLVDDEQQARNVLKRHIRQLGMLELAGECQHAIAAYEFLQNNEVDLVFLDIQMPKLNGLDFLRSLEKRPTVILTTAYRNFAFEGFQLDVADYLLKPISFKRFLKSLQKAIQFPSQLIPEENETTLNQKPFIYFRINRQMTKVYFDQVCYFESLKDYVKIVMPQQTLVTKLSISKLEKMLPPYRFVRIHRSYIVNTDHISSFNNSQVEVGDQVISIGRIYKGNWVKAVASL
ncbi:MAG: LytTR family DNA-binding domain-containing protein [Bacteroidota bacterium]